MLSPKENKDYKIFDASFKDVPHILTIWNQTLKFHEELEPEHYSSGDRALKVYAEIIRMAINSPQHYVRVVKKTENQLVVAFLYGYIRNLPEVFKHRRQGYVSDISVDKNYQRKGIGEMLLKDFIKWAILKGATSISLNVHIKNKSAINFYERLGLKKQMYIMRAPIQEIIEKDDSYFSTYENEII